MEMGFWKKLKKPIFGLAPMYDVTDSVFRKIAAKYGGPDVMFTEFVSCDGLCSADGKKKLLARLKYSEKEHPIVAQVFGANPETFAKSAEIIRELGFNGIDINMGCPDKAVIKQGAGAKLIENPKLAQKLIREAKRGAGKMPVSVKTRIGYNKNEIAKWLPYLLEMEPAAITIHGRTKKEMSKVPAHWDAIAEAVGIAKKYGAKTLILGNGDVKSCDDGLEKIKKCGVDGVLIGRAAVGNPWIFCGREASPKGKLKVMLEHAKLFELANKGKNFNTMRKHIRAYVCGFAGASSLRTKLMSADNAREIKTLVKNFV